MPRQTDLPGPVPVSMVICDSMAKDLLTNKFHLMGLFTVIGAHRFPSLHTFAVYATVTNLRENLVAFFEIVDSEEQVLERSDDLPLVKPADMLDESSVAAIFHDVAFFLPGDYFVRLWANQRLIIDKRLIVKRVA